MNQCMSVGFLGALLTLQTFIRQHKVKYVNILHHYLDGSDNFLQKYLPCCSSFTFLFLYYVYSCCTSLGCYKSASKPVSQSFYSETHGKNTSPAFVSMPELMIARFICEQSTAEDQDKKHHFQQILYFFLSTEEGRRDVQRRNEAEL